MQTFGQELFAYITTLVPYWRVCDEAWALGKGDHHLTGIGVQRNHGGQVLVMSWDEDTRRQLTHFRKHLQPLVKRIVVVVDDRDNEDLQAIAATVAPIRVLLWSCRPELGAFVIKDTVYE